MKQIRNNLGSAPGAQAPSRGAHRQRLTFLEHGLHQAVRAILAPTDMMARASLLAVRAVLEQVTGTVDEENIDEGYENGTK